MTPPPSLVGQQPSLIQWIDDTAAARYDVAHVDPLPLQDAVAVVQANDPHGRQASAVPAEEWLAEITLSRGVSLIPAGFAEEYRRLGLAFVRVEGIADSAVALAWKPSSTNAPDMAGARPPGRAPAGARLSSWRRSRCPAWRSSRR